MAKSPLHQSNSDSDERCYISDCNSLSTRALSKRSAAKEAAFFLPHLCSGMSLLDCGCGPGTITVGLAEIVAPGDVVGIDIKPSQFEVGKASALGKRVSNIRFAVGNIYELPFPDGSFDAVFIHAVLYHLSEPRRALTEAHRVLTRGGVIGVRDADRAGNVFTPSNPTLDRARALIARVHEHSGGNPYFGRMHRLLLREVDFVCIKASASYDCFGTPEATKDYAQYMACLILQPHVTNVIVKRGWADLPELEKMSAAIMAWGEHPDAFFVRCRCEAVAWKE